MAEQKQDTRDRTFILLFDVDGTLTAARKKILPEMEKFVKETQKKVVMGIVGGSDLDKQLEQLGPNCVKEWDFVFSENGLVAFQDGESIGKASFKDHMGEDKLKKLINFILKYVADLDIPINRGTFIEFRSGMMNVSPIGRNCSQQEREEFEKYDAIHKIRPTMVEALKKEFPDFGLTYSIGGQISFDVFPNGWDKTYCLPFLKDRGFKTIHFFGDKTYKGGNDHEIFESSETIGHTVTCPDDTVKLVKEILSNL